MKNLQINFIIASTLVLLPARVAYCENVESGNEQARREVLAIPKAKEVLGELKEMREAMRKGNQSITEDQLFKHAEEIIEHLVQIKFTAGLRTAVLDGYIRSLKSEKAINFLARYIFDNRQVESGEDMIAHLTWAGDGVAYFGTNSGIAIEALTRLHLPSFPKYADFTSSELHKEACEKWAKQRLEAKGISFSFVGGLPTAVNQAALEILPKESTRDRKTNPNFVYAFVLFGLMATLLFVYVQKYRKNRPPTRC